MGLQIILFGFDVWLGLYLLARDFSAKQLRFTGWGLIAYSFVLAFDLLTQVSTSATITNTLQRSHWAVLLFPALFWTGAIIQFLPSTGNKKYLFERIWGWLLLPIAWLTAGSFVFTNTLWDISKQMPKPIGFLIFGMTSLLPLAAALVILPNQLRQIKANPKRATGLILLAAFFFALGSGIAILQLDWIPHTWAILAIGIDLEVLGFSIAYLDAFDQGETLLPDFLRSLTVSALIATLFGSQVAFAITISTGPTLPMMGVLLLTISAAIAIQVFSDPLQKLLDQLVFARLPHLRQERAELRGVAAALPRANTNISQFPFDETEFIRFTRRALSHFGDLPKLASNPLTHLPLIEKRLQTRDVKPNTLERAAELKTLLAESIERLKPPTEYSFGTSDEWRFYNALYYPYVLGLRPYSRRTAYDQLDEPTRQALDWFRTMVPERTLHNWQNAAAALIAKDLRELILL